MQKRETRNVGPIIGTFVAIIAIVMIALYIFASHISNQAEKTQATSSAAATRTGVRADDIQTLRNDLNNAIK